MRWSPGTSLAVGLFLLALGFVPVMISAPWLPTGVGAGSLIAALSSMAPALLGTVIFSFGSAIVFPFIMDILPAVGSERMIGTYYGVFYLGSALLTTAVSWVVGELLQLDQPALRSLPAAALVVVGTLGAVAIYRMQRRGLLEQHTDR